MIRRETQRDPWWLWLLRALPMLGWIVLFLLLAHLEKTAAGAPLSPKAAFEVALIALMAAFPTVSR